MVKIRQDTKLKWSNHLYRKFFDQVKVDLVLDYLDEQFDLIFSQRDYYKQYYDLFQFINLMRILPYTSSMQQLGLVDKLIEAHFKG